MDATHPSVPPGGEISFYPTDLGGGRVEAHAALHRRAGLLAPLRAERKPANAAVAAKVYVN
jgi:hypothetical protein